MKRDFNEWFSKFRKSIADYKHSADFETVYKNVDAVKFELGIVHSLIYSKDIEKDFETMIIEYPKTLRCIPILIAARDLEIQATDGDGTFIYDFKNMNQSVEQYKIFMRKTGLFDLLQNHGLKNLFDYVMGVETGLSSNGKKNRTGKLMEALVESYLQKSGVNEYYKEMKTSVIQDKWGIDLSAISNNGKTEKRFDFVVKTDSMIYGIETNFYTSSGSKPNETARSYKTLAQEADTIDGFTFVWFTDGLGWKPSRHNLEETFDVMEHIYSIDDMENGIMKKIFK